MFNPKNSDALNLTNLSTLPGSSAEGVRASDQNLEAIDNLYSELFHCKDTRELYQKITDVALSQTSATSTYLSLFESARGRLKIRFASGAINRNLMGTEYEYSEGILGQVWESGESLFTNDPSTSLAIHTFDAGTQILASPLMQNDTVVGVLALVVETEGDKNIVEELTTAKRVLNLAEVASSNLTMLATTQSALQHMHALVGISRELNGVSSTSEACVRVCEQLIGGLSTCQSGVVLFDCAGQAVKSTLVRSPERALAKDFQTDESALEQLAVQCLDKKNVIIESPEASGSDYYAFAVPLMRDEKIIGAVCVSRTTEKPAFDSALLDTLRTITLQLGNALERLNLTKALEHQAFHDPLTRLANRAKFEMVLRETLEAGAAGALLFIDLDGFKAVNDTLGHGVGDQLLSHVAKRLTNKLKQCDTLARMGGDEFAVILRESNDATSATVCANRLLGVLSRPFEIQAAQVTVGASIGISRFPQDGTTVDTLLRNADMAMYEAKNKGKGCVLMFNQGTVDSRAEVSHLLTEMRRALHENEFELHYQPQLCCSFNKVVGAEALLRWKHPEKGLILPNEFIPLAEQTGFVEDIGEWVLDEALKQVSKWQALPELVGMRVGINVAAPQLRHDEFVSLVFEKMAYYNVPAHLIELELTESVVMDDVTEVAKRLKILQSAGIRIAIDDFGTGYSSLSYLQDLPLDTLKIDRAFVSRLESEEVDQSLANTIALLALGLGLETVAEGVETLKQRDAITAMGCDLIQGRYYSDAVPPEKLLQYIQSVSVDEHGNKLG